MRLEKALIAWLTIGLMYWFLNEQLGSICFGLCGLSFWGKFGSYGVSGIELVEKGSDFVVFDCQKP